MRRASIGCTRLRHTSGRENYLKKTSKPTRSGYGCPLHSNRGQPLQAIFWRVVPQVFKRYRSTIHIGRTLWRCVWQSHRRTYLRASCSFKRILLAHHEIRRWKLCQKVWSRLEVHSHSSYSLRSPQSDHKLLTIRIMGNGYSWPSTCRSSTEEISACSHWLLYQMDRGRNLCQHQRQGCFQVRSEKHRFPIWNPTSNHSG